jgi:methionine sulfoxide reductase heme-binding subunit
MHTNPTPYQFWITSRAAGFAALILASLAVSLGLLMSTKLLKGRGADLRATHEILSLSTIVAIVLHGVALLGDGYLHPSLADISIPFVSSYKTIWTTLGILGGWALVLLGLSYYARRRIGAARWRKFHRFTALAWLAGLGHALGEGTDAGQLWFLAMLAVVAIPALALLATRVLKARRVALDKPRELAPTLRPARPALGQRDRVKAPAGNLHPGVAGVRVHRDPPAWSGKSPALETR